MPGIWSWIHTIPDWCLKEVDSQPPTHFLKQISLSLSPLQSAVWSTYILKRSRRGEGMEYEYDGMNLELGQWDVQHGLGID